MYSAALDCSGYQVALAIAITDKQKIVFKNYKFFKGRDSASLLNWIFENLEENNIDIKNIKEWTVGSGPGSFTGMRIASAIVLGFAFDNKQIRTRTIPTALAIAFSYQNDKIAILYDAKKNELVLFKVENIKNNQTSQNIISDLKNLQKNCKLIALKSDKIAIEKMANANCAILENITFIEHIPIENLLFINYDNWKCDLTELIYIRPAVHKKGE